MKWIPITESIPEVKFKWHDEGTDADYFESERVLISGQKENEDTKGVYVAFLGIMIPTSINAGGFHFFGNAIWESDTDDRLENVTAWAPLPEIYKEENNDV